MPLGSLLAPSKAVLDGLGTPKTLKTECFLIFLQMQVFATLKLLMGLLEPILAPLRPMWSQKAFQKVARKCSKKCPRTGQKHDPKNDQTSAKFGPRNGVQNGLRWRRRAIGTAIQEVSWKLLVPRCAQDGRRWPQVAQDSPKLAQKGSQDRPKMGQMGQDGSKIGPTKLQIAFLLLILLFPFPIPCLFLSNGGAPLSCRLNETLMRLLPGPPGQSFS